MSNDWLTVEKGTAADIPAVKALVDANWREVYGPIIGAGEVDTIVSTRHAVDLMARQAADDGALFLLLRDGDEILGHAFAVRHPDHVYLDRLHVAPGLRGGGHGTRLMDAVESWAGEGVPVRLEVLAGNDAAVGYYKAKGFIEAAMTSACGGLAGIPAHVMEKTAGVRPNQRS